MGLSYNESRDEKINEALAAIAGAVRWFQSSMSSAPEFVRSECDQMAEQIAQACEVVRVTVEADTELDEHISELEDLQARALRDKVVALYPADARYCRHGVVTEIEETRRFCHICRTFVTGGGLDHA